MEEKICINCKSLKTGRIMECKRRRKNKEIIDIFSTTCPKYEWNEVETVCEHFTKAKVKK